MTIEQVRKLIHQIDKALEPLLLETHISWVILTKDDAYKIKKPLKYSFLDFSTLERRHDLCQREVLLNKRLAGNMYLGVVAIREKSNQIVINESNGKIIDYAVHMRRMDESRQMDRLLKRDEVFPAHMHEIAHVLASFHRKTRKIPEALDIGTLQEDFADILESERNGLAIRALLNELLGVEAVERIGDSIAFSATFLDKKTDRFALRAKQGFRIDGHGDLHSGNIFLLSPPVIFDCIEFNDHFRAVDVLDELAFFCMDLELYKKHSLVREFLLKYGEEYPCMNDLIDLEIFRYFKLYRSTVKIKVNALKILQMRQGKKVESRKALLKQYYRLFLDYYIRLVANAT